MSAVRRGITTGSGRRTELAGKRKANELASSGVSAEPANRRPATGAGSTPLPATTEATGEQAAASSQQPGPSGLGATYAAILAANAAPSLPSTTLKPDSEPSESGVSIEKSKRRMSNDMFGPLSDMPNGTTSNAQVANDCLPAGQRPNKTPIYISGVTDTRAFLAWLRASCPGGLLARLKSDKLMVVPSTADGFRAAVSALRSLDGKDRVSFHTFTLPEDRCARLLVKNLGRVMPESVVREELESLNICFQGVTQLRSGRRDPDPAKDRPSNPTSLCQWHAGLRFPRCVRSPNSAVCECRWSRTWLPRVRCNAGAANASATRSATADTHLGASLVGASTSPVGVLTRGISLRSNAAGKPHSELPWLC